MKSATTTSSSSPVLRFSARLLTVAAWVYALAAIAICAIMYLLGDRWWPAALPLFGPRWLVALPLVLLVPLALWLNRRTLLPLLLAALVIFLPFMGLRYSLGAPQPNGAPSFRVITCNIHSEENVPALLGLAHEVRADLVALQECSPEIEKKAVGWHVIHQGGLALLSRQPFFSQGVLQTVRVPYRWPAVSMLHGTVRMPGGDVTICNIHLPTPRFGLQGLLNRRTGLDAAKSGEVVNETWYRENNARTVRNAVDVLSGPIVVAGDFNTPVESVIYRTVWGNLANAFDKVGRGYGITQRVSVKGFSFGARIDHVLAGKGLVPRVCEVGPDIGSDHLPVIADIGFSR